MNKNSAMPALPPLPPCPLDQERQHLLAALEQNCGLVLSASPGAGKSSRVPLWLLAAPWLRGRNVLLLEPRRVAARALARYMAALLGENVGHTVGLRMRDENRTGPHTRIEVVTEGVLTRMLQEQPDLPATACVIFDEFHERSLAADMGLALCLESRAVLRPDLRLVVMSATLDVQAVSDLMGQCPAIHSPGRCHPVDLHYLPHTLQTGGKISSAGGSFALWQHMASVILTLLQKEPGSLLAFLPGAGEIRQTASFLEERLPPDVLLHSLHGNLSAAQQDAAIAPAPPGKRKVVLATSIAETSLTIEGVRMVVDAGLARLSRFAPASGLSRLVTERVSLAGADQRTGRAGRTEPGICCRLWAKEEEKGMRPHIRPEILDADLTGLLLQLAAWGASDPSAMPWLDAPPLPHLAVARQCLELLGAFTPAGKPTDLGLRMAALPLEPRSARMLLWGVQHGHGPLACCLAALLEERDPLANTQRPEKRGQWGWRQTDSDLALRLDWLCRSPHQGATAPAREHARQRVRRQSLRLTRLLAQIMKTDHDPSPIPDHKQNAASGLFADALADVSALGLLTAVAWPEYVAMLQPGGQKGDIGAPMRTYLMRSGRAARLLQTDSLARSEFLAVAQVDGTLPHGRIRLAAALSGTDMEELFSSQAVQTDITCVTEAGQVTARRQRRLGAIVLEDTPLPRPEPENIVAALCAHVRERGLTCLPWNVQSLQWRARVALLHELEPDAWPAVSDAALLGSLEAWLGPFMTNCTSLAALSAETFSAALHSLLLGNGGRLLDRLAPTHWQAPSGAQRPITYGEEGGPALDVKLQEMFGCVDTPCIAGGRVPLLLRLNSPAGRPLQVTRDLAHFWRNGYPAVRGEMRGRYPRHPWPEDPLTATATALTKKNLAASGKK
nr:ATP-dependent helicase HrpB [uncultured Desulfovibrio sp.]